MTASLPPGRMARVFAALTAVVACLALGLQFRLLHATLSGGQASLAEVIWRFLGFFTLLTNMLVAWAAIRIAAALPVSARFRFIVVCGIVFVGVVYSVALRSTWQPQGWQAVADHGLHDATPLLFALTWLALPHGTLGWRDVASAACWPLGYCFYALLRGGWDGWYAYWFLDPGHMGASALAVSIVLLVAGFLMLGGVLLWINRLLAPASRSATAE